MLVVEVEFAAAQGLTIEAWLRIEDVFQRYQWLFGYSIYYPEEEKHIPKVSASGEGE